MAQYITIFKNETITLSKHIDKDEYWLYDKTRGMNLAMCAKTEQVAFVEAIIYYQKRLNTVEKDYRVLRDKVNIFIEDVAEDD
jgi:hypothetical protein